MKKTFWMACLAVLSSAGYCFADGSSFKGQFVYDGAPPAAKELGATAADKTACGDANMKVLDETYVVNPENKGFANIIVYLTVPPTGGKKPPVSADAAKLKAKELIFDNKNLRFEPHVLVVHTGQKIVLSNSDPISHNTNIAFAGGIGNTASNESLPAGGKINKTYAKEERVPTNVACNIHPYMKGYLLVRDNPYFAVTDKDGKFEISNVPDGEWQFTVWQEKSGYVTTVKVGDKPTTWAKGKLTQKFAGKEVDLGKILVSPKNFEGK
jgi:plastocyanin